MCANQTFDLRTGVHVLTAIETPCLDLLVSTWKYRLPVGNGTERFCPVSGLFVLCR